MSGFWAWLKGAIATVYRDRGLLGIAILVVLGFAIVGGAAWLLWAVGVDIPALLERWGI